MATEKNEREREQVNREWIEPLPKGVSFEELARTVIRVPLRDIEAVERDR